MSVQTSPDDAKQRLLEIEYGNSDLSSELPSSHQYSDDLPRLVRTSSDFDALNGVDEFSHRQGTIGGSIVNLAATTMGAGILSLPVAMKYCGWLLGSLLIVGVAVVADYSLVVLSLCSKRSGVGTLEGVGSYYYGPRMGKFVEWNLILLLFMACVIFLIIIAGLCSNLFSVWIGKDSLLADQTALMGFACLVIYPVTLLDNLHALRFTSTAALISLAYVWVAAIVSYTERDSEPEEIEVVNFSWDIFLAIPMHVGAFCCQFNIIPLYTELKHRRMRNIQKVIHGSLFAICVPVYIVFGLIGYFTFGKDVKGNLLDNFSEDNVAMMIGKVALTVNMVLKFPLISLPLRNLSNEMIFGEKQLTKFHVAIEMACMLAVVFTLAYAIETLEKAMDLIGSTVGVLIGFIIPGLFGYKAAVNSLERSCSIAMATFGLVVGVVGLVVTIIGMVG